MVAARIRFFIEAPSSMADDEPDLPRLARAGGLRLALENEAWHDIEHLCFLLTSLLFWNCLIRPWPSRSRHFGWMLLPYLVGADLVNTMLSASLAFCGRPVYLYYVKNRIHLAFRCSTIKCWARC